MTVTTFDSHLSENGLLHALRVAPSTVDYHTTLSPATSTTAEMHGPTAPATISIFEFSPLFNKDSTHLFENVLVKMSATRTPSYSKHVGLPHTTFPGYPHSPLRCTGQQHLLPPPPSRRRKKKCHFKTRASPDVAGVGWHTSAITGNTPGFPS